MRGVTVFPFWNLKIRQSLGKFERQRELKCKNWNLTNCQDCQKAQNDFFARKCGIPRVWHNQSNEWAPTRNLNCNRVGQKASKLKSEVSPLFGSFRGYFVALQTCGRKNGKLDSANFSQGSDQSYANNNNSSNDDFLPRCMIHSSQKVGPSNRPLAFYQSVNSYTPFRVR